MVTVVRPDTNEESLELRDARSTVWSPAVDW